MLNMQQRSHFEKSSQRLGDLWAHIAQHRDYERMLGFKVWGMGFRRG